MHFSFLIITYCFIAVNSFSQAIQKYSPADEAMLSSLANKWQNYWNIHDMDSMGSLLRDDVDFINVGGRWMKGKEAAVLDHKIKHQGVKFKTSTWQTDSVAIKYVNPDLAIMHIGWGITGDFEDNGTARKPRHGIFTWIVTKENNRWLILAVQNTNILEPTSQR